MIFMKPIKVLTVTRIGLAQSSFNYNYYRLSVYEFKGEPPRAQFVEDVGLGFYNYSDAEREGKRRAQLLELQFCPGIQVMDNLEKVTRYVLE